MQYSPQNSGGGGSGQASQFTTPQAKRLRLTKARPENNILREYINDQNVETAQEVLCCILLVSCRRTFSPIVAVTGCLLRYVQDSEALYNIN